MICPVCDFPPGADIWAPLLRIDDPDLLLTLACDFAEHVADLAPNPALYRFWLAATRAWRDDPGAARAAAAQAHTKAEEARGSVRTRRQTAKAKESEAMEAVAWATLAAGWLEAAQPERRMDLETAGWSAIHSAQATADPAVELGWQLAHVRETACICRALLQPLPEYPRSRRSLLAN